MSLYKCQLRWIDKFSEMEKTAALNTLAAPFLSVLYENSARDTSGPILLVGKATAGDWHLSEFKATASRPSAERAEERREVTRAHLRAMYERPSSAFWRFWKNLASVGSPVIWSNLAKIGVQRGNPTGRHLQAQADLACETMRAEIAEYKPSLVVIAGDYAKEQLVYPVFGERTTWAVRSDGICWINRTSFKPAVLWTDHPERKKSEMLDLWLEKAHELVSSPN